MCFYAWFKIIGNKLPRMKKIMGCVELGKWFGDHSSAGADIAEILQKVALNTINLLRIKKNNMNRTRDSLNFCTQCALLSHQYRHTIDSIHFNTKKKTLQFNLHVFVGENNSLFIRQVVINVTYCSEPHTLIKKQGVCIPILVIRIDESEHEIHVNKNEWVSEWVIDV